jgi:ketosteroid isomerase-like protein
MIILNLKTTIMKKVILKTGTMLFVVMFTTITAFSQTVSEYKLKIESLNKQMAKDMLAGNNERNLQLYTKDAISLPSGEPMLEGLEAIRKSNEEMRSKGVKFNSFEPKTLKVLVEGNLITEVGTYKINVSVPGMESPVEDHGKYLTVWEKQKDGSLKIKIETWNSDVDPMSMMNTAQQPKPEKQIK